LDKYAVSDIAHKHTNIFLRRRQALAPANDCLFRLHPLRRLSIAFLSIPKAPHPAPCCNMNARDDASLQVSCQKPLVPFLDFRDKQGLWSDTSPRQDLATLWPISEEKRKLSGKTRRPRRRYLLDIMISR